MTKTTPKQPAQKKSLPTTEIIFEITNESIDELNWKEMEIVVSKNIVMARPIMARFMVDSDGKKIPLEKAMDVLGELKLPQIKDASRKFGDAMKNMAANPTSGAKS